jgi:nucleolar complex protein 2
VQKIDANVKFTEDKRAKVDFAPNNRKGVTSFLDDLEWEKTPIGAFLVGQRKVREEKAKVMEAARKDEEERKEKDKKESKESKAIVADEDDNEDSVSEDEDEEEMIMDGEDDSESDGDEVMEFGGDDE